VDRRVLRGAIDVRAAIDQELHDIEPVVAGGDIQRTRASAIGDVDIRAEIEQQLNGCESARAPP
jgi:hypothetical protein